MGEGETDTRGIAEAGDVSGKKKKKRKEADIICGILPVAPHSRQWRAHYLVRRLTGAPTTVTPTGLALPAEQSLAPEAGENKSKRGKKLPQVKATVSVMGGRSYWGEGKRLTRNAELARVEVAVAEAGAELEVLGVTGRQQSGQAESSRNTATTAELMAAYQAEQAQAQTHAQAQMQAQAQSSYHHSPRYNDIVLAHITRTIHTVHFTTI